MAVSDQGPIELVVAWIHADAPRAAVTIGEALRRGSTRYFDVCGSAVSDPSAPSAGSKPGLIPFTHVLYRRIVLGFMLDAGCSRWLTDEEIASGVIAAIERDAEDSVVGTVAPWSARPV